MFAAFQKFQRSLRFCFNAAAVLMLALIAGCVGAPTAVGPPSPYGYTCYAGFYRCNLGAQYPVGTSCQCPGLGAPSYGTVH